MLSFCQRLVTPRARNRKLQITLLVCIILVYLSVKFLTFHVRFDEADDHRRKKPVFLPPEQSRDHPIIIWWTPFTPYQRLIKKCSKGSCLFTQSRTEFDNPLTEGILFYGTDLKWTDLPLPRNLKHYWALLHEESPKNNWGFAYEEGISLFNLTSTPSRYSSYPLVTQYLLSLEKIARPLKYTSSQKSRGEMGLAVYIQTDCDTPSDRDAYVKELMKYIKVDSYGKCLHNKDLPKHLRNPVTSMDSDELIGIISQYKFAITMENAICGDYITEKFWRALYAGSVPVVKSSPSIKDWAPDNHSIIVVDDFPSPEALSKYLLYLDQHNEEYEKYLEYKKVGVTNTRLLKHMHERGWVVNEYGEEKFNHIEGFECFVCDKIIEKLTRQKHGIYIRPLIADHNHYDCEYPKPLIKRRKSVTWWKDMLLVWRQIASSEGYKVKAVAEAIKKGKETSEVAAVYKNTQIKDSMEYRLKDNDYET